MNICLSRTFNKKNWFSTALSFSVRIFPLPQEKKIKKINNPSRPHPAPLRLPPRRRPRPLDRRPPHPNRRAASSRRARLLAPPSRLRRHPRAANPPHEPALPLPRDGGPHVREPVRRRRKRPRPPPPPHRRRRSSEAEAATVRLRAPRQGTPARGPGRAHLRPTLGGVGAAARVPAFPVRGLDARGG